MYRCVCDSGASKDRTDAHDAEFNWVVCCRQQDGCRQIQPRFDYEQACHGKNSEVLSIYFVHRKSNIESKRIICACQNWQVCHIIDVNMRCRVACKAHSLGKNPEAFLMHRDLIT
jgi:hypothetical protein